MRVVAAADGGVVRPHPDTGPRRGRARPRAGRDSTSAGGTAPLASLASTGEVTGDDRGHEDAQGQPTQRHIEGAGDLLGEVVSVDRVLCGGIGRCREPRCQRDAHDDAGNAQRGDKSAQRRDQSRGDGVVDQLDPQPDRKKRGNQIEGGQHHAVVARERVIQAHGDKEVGDPHRHRPQAPDGDEQQALSGRRPPGDLLGSPRWSGNRTVLKARKLPRPPPTPDSPRTRPLRSTCSARCRGMRQCHDRREGSRR